ncbi:MULTISPECIES: hypothetical protein [Micromonospora]|uniref:Secreted protein n=1 Tax=Micromonospora sicca TaxID=2202420 RepID=A0A317DNE2_9ACTN|nr:MULTISPECIES: hypothetical protein [unclassified Micromonospora]MBM0225215.1 hypothetical protein [Micromonospora sp. ATA51]PWR15844.1 hypothetical protein DKT69_08930 [Micromonospora sp. 4G51]
MNATESLVTQLPALLGVLIGTAGTMIVTTVTERGRWRRNQTVRWDERRLDAYAEFTRAVKEIHLLAMGMLSAHRTGARTPPLRPEEGLARLAEAAERHSLAWESVLLLGDEATVRAASTWRHAVRNLELAARALPDPPDDLAALVRRADETRDTFYRAARASLDVRGGAVDQFRRAVGSEIPTARR